MVESQESTKKTKQKNKGSWEKNVKDTDRKGIKQKGKKGREEERREGMERESFASGATKPGGGRRESWEAYRHDLHTAHTCTL